MEKLLGAITLWGGGGAIALCFWFIVRHINRADELEKGTEAKFKHLEEIWSSDHKSIKTSMKAIESGFDFISKMNLSFQKDLNAELLSVKKEALEIEKSIRATAESAKELKLSVEEVKGSLRFVQDSMKMHRELIRKGGQILQKHHGDLGEMKTTVKEVSDTLRIFGHKIGKKGGQ